MITGPIHSQFIPLAERALSMLQWNDSKGAAVCICVAVVERKQGKYLVDTQPVA
jgi:hypothetical protein